MAIEAPGTPRKHPGGTLSELHGSVMAGRQDPRGQFPSRRTTALGTRLLMIGTRAQVSARIHAGTRVLIMGATGWREDPGRREGSDQDEEHEVLGGE